MPREIKKKKMNHNEKILAKYITDKCKKFVC